MSREQEEEGALNRKTSNQAYLESKPDENQIRLIASQLFDLPLTPVLHYTDAVLKTDALLGGDPDITAAIRKRDEKCLVGTDLGLVFAQPFAKILDLFQNIGRDVKRKHFLHICEIFPWIHCVGFGKIWWAYQRSKEYLFGLHKQGLRDDEYWIRKTWGETPDNIPKSWSVRLVKFPDDRPPHHPKIVMYMPPLPTTFKDDLRSAKYEDGRWRVWDWKLRKLI
jgi:hypothetical protein